MKYRKKPVIVEAEQFTRPPEGAVHTDIFMEFFILLDSNGYYLEIPTLEGNMRANEGDWIITEVHGEKYPCKPDIFEKTYEKVR